MNASAEEERWKGTSEWIPMCAIPLKTMKYIYLYRWYIFVRVSDLMLADSDTMALRMSMHLVYTVHIYILQFLIYLFLRIFFGVLYFYASSIAWFRCVVLGCRRQAKWSASYRHCLLIALPLPKWHAYTFIYTHLYVCAANSTIQHLINISKICSSCTFYAISNTLPFRIDFTMKMSSQKKYSRVLAEKKRKENRDPAKAKQVEREFVKIHIQIDMPWRVCCYWWRWWWIPTLLCVRSAQCAHIVYIGGDTPRNWLLQNWIRSLNCSHKNHIYCTS